MSNPALLVKPNLDPAFQAKAIIQDLDKLPKSVRSWRQLTPIDSPTEPKITTSNISLKIAHWYCNLKSNKSKEEKAHAVLDYILKVAAAVEGFQNSVPYNIILNTKCQLEMGSATQSIRAQEKVQTRSQMIPFTQKLRDFVFDNFPVFNLWDALALAYTICAEPIYTTKGAELHLYQFYILTKTLGEWVGDGPYFPSTLACTWSDPEGCDAPLLVAWAFTCTSKPKDKKKLTEARRAYRDSLFSLVGLTAQEFFKATGGKGWAGNCPEFSTWAQVCRTEGQYFSLCLNTLKDSSLKYCDSCEQVSKAASKKKGIVVTDMWNVTSLVLTDAGKIESGQGYDGKKLKDVKTILNDGAPVPL
jgi:hypothetical protein